MNLPASDPSTPDGHRTYGLAAVLRARMMGVALAGLGLLMVLATVVVMVTGLSLDVLSVLVLLVLVVVFGLGFLLSRRWYVVRLDRYGYQVRFVRGAGVKAARWADVHDLGTSTVAGARCVVLHLRDGRSSTIPVDLVEGDSEEFVRELSRRLDAGHGHRRLG